MNNKNEMKSWDNYTDKDNMLFAKGEYTAQKVGHPYIVGKNHKQLGYVQEKYGFDEKGSNDTSCEGMQAYVEM